MDISRSGRIRKKSSKLADFESPDEIDGVNPIRKTPKISVSKLVTNIRKPLVFWSSVSTNDTPSFHEFS